MTKQQMRERKAVVNEQVNLLKMMYHKVNVVDYKLGLVACELKENNSRIKLYLNGKEVLEDKYITRAHNDKYFITISLNDNNNKYDRFRLKTDRTLIINKKTFEVIHEAKGVVKYNKVICNGKYIICGNPVLTRGDVLLLDINNNKVVIKSNKGLDGILEMTLDKLGKGVYR